VETPKEALVDGTTPGSVDVSSQAQPNEVYILIASLVKLFYPVMDGVKILKMGTKSL